MPVGCLLRAEASMFSCPTPCLEHVVDDRDRLAQEMQRVSKGDMFVSVPYQFAPIEPHYLLPFFQFVPESVKKFLLFRLKLRVGRKTKANYDQIKLFKKKELRVLFPQSRILTLWVYVFPINLVALQKTLPAQPSAA